LEGGQGDDTLSASNFNKVYYDGGTGTDIFVIESSSDTWTASANFNGYDRNNDGTTDLVEFWERPGVIADYKDGTDKIGLRGDWSGKTLVIKQGTTEGGFDMSEHTILYSSDKDDSGEYTQIIGIVANTFAANLTIDDFVLLDAGYNQSAIATSISFATSLTFNGGTDVGPAQSGVLIYNAADSSATSFSITGGNDASLFEIDNQTGALTLKESVTLTDIKDFNRDGTYDVQITASTGGTDVVGNVAVSVAVDNTIGSYSNLKLVQETNTQGESVMYMTGTMTDDSAGLSDGRIYINLRHETKGSNLYFEANDWNGVINDDGTFQTQSKTLTGSTPDGTWYVERIEVTDDAGNRFNEYYRGAIDSSPLKVTLVNPIYLGNDDTTLATYSDLALKVEDGELSVTGKFMDDGAPLNVAEFNFQITHTITGARKWFNGGTEQINADGTFETRSEDLRTSDPSGLWVLNRIELTDDAGNKFNQNFNRGDDSNPMQATLNNPIYLGDSDKTSATASNFQLIETTNYDGKPAIQISGKLMDDGQPLTSGEVSIRLEHTKSGNNIWLDARDSQIDQDGNFVTWIRTLENNDPSGTWFVNEIRVKDDAGNQSYDSYDAQDSSPYKVSITNSSYSGGQSGDSSATDLEAPAYADLAITVVSDGDGTSSVVFSGKAVDPNDIEEFYVRFKNANDSSADKVHFYLNDRDFDSDGAFSKTVELDQYLSGTWIADDWRLRDTLDNQKGGNIDTGSTESPELGLTFDWTNPDLDSSDKSVPVLSNLTATSTNDGDDTYTLKVTGTATDASAIQHVQIQFKNINDPNSGDIWTSTSTFDSDGNFTINVDLNNDNYKGGTWNATRIEVKDKVGNSEQKEISSGGSGTPLEGLTFDLDNATENASDKSVAALSSLTATVAADGDGTFTLTFAGTATDDSTMDWVHARFESTTDDSEFWVYAWQDKFDGSGNFSTIQTLDSNNPGKYILTSLRHRDMSGNEQETSIQEGGAGSALEGVSFTYADVPTDIDIGVSTIKDDTFGESLGLIKVNDVPNDGLFTITITGTDASSLEVSSKGYLRLKDDVKLDYGTKTTLEFTLIATNPTSDAYSQSFTITVIDNSLVSSSIGLISLDGDDLGVEDSLFSGISKIGGLSLDGDDLGFDDSSFSGFDKIGYGTEVSIANAVGSLDISELGIQLDSYVEEIIKIDDIESGYEANLLQEREIEPVIDNFNEGSAFLLVVDTEEEDLLFINEII
jgi:hypothetical protein